MVRKNLAKRGLNLGSPIHLTTIESNHVAIFGDDGCHLICSTMIPAREQLLIESAYRPRFI